MGKVSIAFFLNRRHKKTFSDFANVVKTKSLTLQTVIKITVNIAKCYLK